MPKHYSYDKRNIALTGRNGRMGRMVCCVAEQRGLKVSTLTSSWGLNKFVFTAASTRSLLEDELIISSSACIIDFSKPKGTFYYIKLILPYKTNIVVGTTGFSNGEEIFLKKAGRFIGILVSPNTSVGVNKFFSIISIASALLKETYDVMVSELHHKRKADSPSGTAIQLKRIIEDNRSWELGFGVPNLERYRTGQSQLNLYSVRAGNVVGEHTVMFLNNNERIEIKHSSSNRLHYAQGALLAANCVARVGKGTFSMSDIVDGTL